MQFLRADASEGVDALEAKLHMLLWQEKRVLWFTSGGSNIPWTVQIMSKLDDELTKQLTIMPGDERFGLVGHENSNVQQLLDAGFTPKRATFIPILTNTTLEETVRRYNDAVKDTLSGNDVIVAQLGMGTDGHIAGILPQTAAVTADSLVTSYAGDDYTRVTLTFPALRRIHTAYLFAYGTSKLEALRNLRDKNLPLTDQPAQILREIPEALIYNDQLEQEGIS